MSQDAETILKFDYQTSDFGLAHFGKVDLTNCLSTEESMAWAIPRYSKTQVDGATRDLLSNDLFKYNDALEKINNWRAAHNFPLNTFQHGLRRRAKRINSKCLVAQRIKRLSSIMSKVERFKTMRLSMMQDLGGCRAVMTDIAEVNRLVASFEKSEIKHKLHVKDNYIAAPQKSGYRGIHLVYRYFSDRKSTYNGLKIEIQIRSNHQHAWATAVETVGTFIKQALKSSQGEAGWLRFFALMGTAIAQMENSNPVPETPTDPRTLKAEIKKYASLLDVEMHLRAYGHAVKEIQNIQSGDHYFLLVLDPSAPSIEITGFRQSDLERANRRYIEVEAQIKGTTKDAVLVSVESINTLSRAYPNYFLNTDVFIWLLNDALK